MPNWCSNTLIIEAPSLEALDAVLMRIKGRRKRQFISFTRIAPHPKENMGIRGNLQPGNKDKWYDWNLEHWGTKWNAHDCDLKVDNNVATLGFRTAWDRPREAILALSCLFPDVDFELRYSEWQAGFQGLVRFKAGDDDEIMYMQPEFGFGPLDLVLEALENERNWHEAYGGPLLADGTSLLDYEMVPIPIDSAEDCQIELRQGPPVEEGEPMFSEAETHDQDSPPF